MLASKTTGVCWISNTFLIRNIDVTYTLTIHLIRETIHIVTLLAHTNYVLPMWDWTRTRSWEVVELSTLTCSLWYWYWCVCSSACTLKSNVPWCQLVWFHGSAGFASWLTKLITSPFQALEHVTSNCSYILFANFSF